MLGLMQSWPLTVDRIIAHAASRHGGREVAWRSADGAVRHTDYAAIEARARQVSHGLAELGLAPGDRVATLAWNEAAHVEVWYGAMGIGCVCHTLNPRLDARQLGWIIAHADDRVVFVAPDLLDLLRAALAGADRSPLVVVLAEEGEAADRGYGEWLADRPATGAAGAPAWGGFAEESACGLCYTSGTIGDPKGVLYSHRSNVLHSLMTIQPDVFGLAAADVVMPIVPMFHANAWGLVFSAPAVGAGLVLPGRRLDAPSVHDLIVNHGVTVAAAVPTVWQALLEHLRDTGGSLGTLRRIVVGGATCPDWMLRAFHERHGVEVRHAWGMTELSPLGTASTPPARLAGAPFEQQVAARTAQGRPPFGVELRLADEAGNPLAEDGQTPGRLLVRGPAVASRYFRADQPALDDDGFFDTGDIATIDGDGVMRITDRAKDIIKSGGEWISSVAIENAACGEPGVRRVAVIGVPHPRWGERPLLLVEAEAGQASLEQRLADRLARDLPRWWQPTIALVDAIPLGATGKVDKKALRALHLDRD